MSLWIVSGFIINNQPLLHTLFLQWWMYKCSSQLLQARRTRVRGFTVSHMIDLQCWLAVMEILPQDNTLRNSLKRKKNTVWLNGRRKQLTNNHHHVPHVEGGCSGESNGLAAFKCSIGYSTKLSIHGWFQQFPAFAPTRSNASYE